MTTSTPAAPRARRARRLRTLLAPALLLAGVGMVAAAFALPLPTRAKPKPAADKPADFTLPLPDFTFTERSGKPVSRADLLGKVWVASFVFTRCTGPCPSVTATIAKLQADLDLAHSDDLRLVTFTVDPGRDGPKELRQYADNFRAHPDRWLFLTGPEPELHKLVNGGFKLMAQRSGKADPVEGQEFDHSSLVAVVDKAGNMRGVFDGYRGPNDEGGVKYDDGQQRLRELVAELRRV